MQAHIVHAGPHDRHAAAGLGDLRDVTGPGSSAKQPGWPDWGPAQLPTARRPDPGWVEAAAAVQHLEHDPVPGNLSNYLVPVPGSGMPEHVRARLRGGQKQVGDAGLIEAKPTERIAEHVPHNGNAERFAGEHETEPDRPDVPDISGRFR